jgi:hypothetical protein
MNDRAKERTLEEQERMTHSQESLPTTTGTADIAGLGQTRVPDRTGDGGTAPRNEMVKPAALLVADDSQRFRTRWSEIQTGFVDEPRKAVEQADGLVAELMKRLAEGFANERATLEKHWHEGNDVSTEDLRQALQRYRSFFDRLLSV